MSMADSRNKHWVLVLRQAKRGTSNGLRKTPYAPRRFFAEVLTKYSDPMGLSLRSFNNHWRHGAVEGVKNLKCKLVNLNLPNHT